MLPLQLLRVTTRKGAIRPLFCTEKEEVSLAGRIIEEFEAAARNGETRGQLEKRAAALESGSGASSGSGSDFKLVRGLYALLERKCTFHVEEHLDLNGNIVQPASIRKAVFEESSKRGFALTDLERKDIALAAAAKLGLAVQPDSVQETVEKAMFCDFEDNHILRAFEAIGPENLIGWYNLSLMQTLLFNCTKLEFSVSGGQAWKQVLRRVKWLGLMYSLEAKEEEISTTIETGSSATASKAKAGRKEIDEKVTRKEGEMKTESTIKSKDRKGTKSVGSESETLHDASHAIESQRSTFSSSSISAPGSSVVCKLDGPLSLFKMTDRYGTSIAKLLPTIVRSEGWSVHTWIVRKTMSGKKLYEFHISDTNVPEMLFDPYYQEFQAADANKGAAGAERGRNAALFDSVVEQKFASKVAQSSLPETGWVLVREPDPLVLPAGGIFIPDFAFEKHGRKVYVEIVGFWTKEYLEKKTRKIAELVSQPRFPAAAADARPGRPLEIFIAINEDLACSKLAASMPKDRLIFYRNDSVPIAPIVEYLKSIDRELVQNKANDPELVSRIDEEIDGSTRDIISIIEIAKRHDIPLELAVELLNNSQKSNYIVSGSYLISKNRARIVQEMLEGISKFADASSVLSANSIPEACHAELVEKLGYQVVWTSMETDSAIVIKRERPA